MDSFSGRLRPRPSESAVSTSKSSDKRHAAKPYGKRSANPVHSRPNFPDRHPITDSNVAEDIQCRPSSPDPIDALQTPALGVASSLPIPELTEGSPLSPNSDTSAISSVHNKDSAYSIPASTVIDSRQHVPRRTQMQYDAIHQQLDLYREQSLLGTNVNEAEPYEESVNFQYENLIARLQRDNMNLSRKLEERCSELQGMTKLLDARTQELQGLQTYLSKADMVSVSECIQVVEDLNIEIGQACASIADVVVVDFELLRDPKFAPLMEQSQRTVCQQPNGPFLLDYIQANRNATEPSIVIQFVLEHVLTCICHFTLSHWMWFDEGASRALHNIYADLRNTESQSVAGRWRALTRKRSTLDNQEATSIIRDRTINIVKAILVLSGWSRTLPAQQGILFLIEERIGVVVKLLLKTEKLLGQSVTSVDLNTFVTLKYCGDLFDSKRMENADRPNLVQEGERVALSTALGLDLKNADTGEHVILLKNKVQLERTILELLSFDNLTAARANELELE